MSHIFVSYSRKDIDIAGKIVKALAMNNLETWIDWKSIPKGEYWEQEIYRGIEEADAFLFLISPDSAKSEMCNKEIAHAIKNNKRILPIVLRDTDVNIFLHKLSKSEISKRNWVFCREKQDDFDKAIEDTQIAIHTDYEWVQAHRRLQVKALEWERKKRGNSFILRGNDLQDAEQQLATNSSKEPYPTDLQREYVFESRNAAERQRRIVTSISIAGVVTLAILALFGFYQAGEANKNAIESKNNAATAIANEKSRATAQARAEEQARINLSGELVAQSQLIGSDSGPDTIRSSLLAIKSSMLNPNPESIQFSNQIIEKLLTPKIEKQYEGVGWFVNFSPDNNLLISGGFGSALCITDVSTGKEVARLYTDEPIYDAIFSSDLQHVAAVGQKTITIWNLGTNEKHQYPPYSGTIGKLFSLPNGEWWVISNIGIWDVIKGTEIFRANIQSLSDPYDFSPNRTTFAFGDSMGNVEVWDISANQRVNLIQSGLGEISILSYSQDGVFLALADIDGNFSVWNTETNKEILREIYPGQVEKISLSSENIFVGVGGSSREVCIWNILFLVKKCGVHDFLVNDVTFSSDGRWIASVDAGGILKTWDVSEFNTPPTHLSNEHVSFGSMSFSSDLTMLATSDNNMMNVWDVYTGKSIATFTSTNPVYSVMFTSNDKSILSGSTDGTLSEWDINQNIELGRLPGNSFATAFAYNAKLNSIVFETTSRERAIIGMQDFVSENGLSTILPLSYQEQSMTFAKISPDGKWLAYSINFGGNLFLTPLAMDGTQTKMDYPVSGEISSIEFSKDGRLLAVGACEQSEKGSCYESSLHIFDIENNQEEFSIRTEWNVTSLKFSPYGKFIAFGNSATVRVWDIQTQAEVARIRHEDVVLAIEFSPTENRILSASIDGVIKISPWEPSEVFENVCAKIPRNLTIVEWKQYLGDEPYQAICPNLPIEPITVLTPTVAQ